MIDPSIQGTNYCRNCNTSINKEQRFCTNCGKPIHSLRAEEIMNNKRPHQLLFAVFGAILVLIIASSFLNNGNASGAFVFDTLFIIISIFFAAITFADFRETITPFRGKLFWLLTVVGLAIGGAFSVNFLADLIRSMGNSQSVDYLFHDTDFPLFYSIISIAVVPAIFEELLFRGILIGQIRKVMNKSSVILVSGFVFAILHLSPISLIWLIPTGIFLGWLRFYTGQLWLGVLYHFTYNTTLILISYFELQR